MDELVVKDLIDRLIDLSFAEDIGDGDHTTCHVFPQMQWENQSC